MPPSLTPSSKPTEEESAASSPLDGLSSVEGKALRWAVKADDELAPSEREALAAWLAAAPEHRQAFDDIRGVAAAVGRLPPDAQGRLRAVVTIDKTRALAAEATRLGSVRGIHPSRRAFAGQALAGVAGTAVLGSAAWSAWQHYERQPAFARVYETPRGRQAEFTLPDGSKLMLDAATATRVTLYRDRREVRLDEGQAIFDVRREDRPFSVLAAATRITVVGTRFSVRHTPSTGDAMVRVSVIEGRVRVASDLHEGAMDDTVVLSPGQAVAAEAAGTLGRVISVAAGAIGMWREGRLDFDNAPLATVVAELRRYGVDNVEVDAAAGFLPVTVSVDVRRPGDFLKGLPLVLPVQLEQQPGKTVIVRASR